ncbi:AIPR family protein [Planktosalinus lacus]|uniref:Putative abortive infection phage resistance protein n=1 Tax=Planktosalinus lacus TaxID=1526573 RepID=A0A8J2YC40_9FLAO|nr:AIPR family protein [Planktosalinus lacus]GGD99655.1 putative abortive infection phage resistance protein [Planktosalinus lacus]
MSTIHVQHIKSHLEKEFEDKIDLSDVKADSKEIENFFLTRSLAAYSLIYHAQASLSIACDSITDGSSDNGLDAVYYDGTAKTLHLVQSKWIHKGTGEPDNGEVKKFISGVRDLFNFKFERFNDKVRRKEVVIRNAICDPKTKYQIILTYTGINDLAEPSRRDFEDLLVEFNDASEIVYFSVFNQSRIHSSLLKSVDSGEPIDLTIQLKSWGKITEPTTGYYGQVNGVEIFDWWDKYRNRLFQKNIRGVLGDTNVNLEIANSLEKQPEVFWFLNNGITLICNTAAKNMVGGASTEIGQFTCSNISIVNGAQTVSTIGRFGEEDSSKLESVFVPVRIITLDKAESDFGQKITKANNTQNRVENRDFVTFDPEQSRIRDELLIDGIDYRISRGVFEKEDQVSFDLIESTTATSCASGDVSIVVQLKREIGKLWDNLEKAPYKKIFNQQTTGRYVYNCVRTQRIIDQAIKEIENTLEQGRDQGIIIHGNRIISLLIFEGLNTKKYQTGKFNFDKPELLISMGEKVKEFFELLKIEIDRNYSNAIIPTLFKNGTKCQKIYENVRKEANKNNAH